MEDYEKKANEFLQKTGTEFEAEFKEHAKHFPDEKETRDIYTITLRRGSRKYVFTFGQSIAESGATLQFKNGRTHGGVVPVSKKVMEMPETTPDERAKKKQRFKYEFEKQNYSIGGMKIIFGKAPTPYDVLACLQKYDPGEFSEFCSEFGYEEDSRKAETIYKAVLKEYDNMKTLYGEEELEQLQEIQ